jgi:hypothetical protein
VTTGANMPVANAHIMQQRFKLMPRLADFPVFACNHRIKRINLDCGPIEWIVTDSCNLPLLKTPPLFCGLLLRFGFLQKSWLEYYAD